MRRAPLAAALLLAGCAVSGGHSPSGPTAPRAESIDAGTLVGSRWVGVASGDVDARSLPRLEFVTPDRVAGYTGCNMFSGGWRVEGGEVRVGPLASTKRACIGAGGEMEQRVVAALAGRVRREGERLVFTAPGGARYEFTPAQAS